jgi:hypothetical protein
LLSSSTANSPSIESSNTKVDVSQNLSTLITPNAYLTDLNADENRSKFWIKIIREVASETAVSSENLQSIHHIISAHVIKGFLLRLTDGSVTYEKEVYPNVLPFIDTDQTMAWCIFVGQNGNRVNATTGQIIEATSLVTDPIAVHQCYARNVSMKGAHTPCS